MFSAVTWKIVHCTKFTKNGGSKNKETTKHLVIQKYVDALNIHYIK